MFQQNETKMYDRTRQDIRNGWFDSILKTNLATSKVKIANWNLKLVLENPSLVENASLDLQRKMLITDLKAVIRMKLRAELHPWNTSNNHKNVHVPFVKWISDWKWIIIGVKIQKTTMKLLWKRTLSTERRLRWLRDFAGRQHRWPSTCSGTLWAGQ